MTKIPIHVKKVHDVEISVHKFEIKAPHQGCRMDGFYFLCDSKPSAEAKLFHGKLNTRKRINKITNLKNRRKSQSYVDMLCQQFFSLPFF